MKIRVLDRKANKIYESGVLRGDYPLYFSNSLITEELQGRFLMSSTELWFFEQHGRKRQLCYPASPKDPLNKWPETEGMLFCEEYIVIFGEADSITVNCPELKATEVMNLSKISEDSFLKLLNLMKI